VPEQLALEERLGHRRAIDGDERAILPAPVAVEGTRNDLLAGPAFARDEHGDVRLCDPLDQLEDRLHRRAPADHLVVAGGPCGRAAETLDLLTELAMLRRAIDGDGEHIVLHRLADEVVGARANRRDRRGEATERRQDDHGHVGPIRHDPLAELDAAHAAHVEVGDDDVEVVAQHEALSLLGRRARRDLFAALPERNRERLAEAGVVVDEQEAGAHGRAAAGTRTVKVVPFPRSLFTVIQPP
jgi:hypothetical protein